MDYTEAKKLKADAADAERLAATALQKARGTECGPVGLTPDHVKASADFQLACAQHAVAFRRMQAIDGSANDTGSNMRQTAKPCRLAASF